MKDGSQASPLGRTWVIEATSALVAEAARTNIRFKGLLRNQHRNSQYASMLKTPGTRCPALTSCKTGPGVSDPGLMAGPAQMALHPFPHLGAACASALRSWGPCTDGLLDIKPSCNKAGNESVSADLPWPHAKWMCVCGRITGAAEGGAGGYHGSN